MARIFRLEAERSGECGRKRGDTVKTQLGWKAKGLLDGCMYTFARGSSNVHVTPASRSHKSARSRGAPHSTAALPAAAQPLRALPLRFSSKTPPSISPTPSAKVRRGAGAPGVRGRTAEVRRQAGGHRRAEWPADCSGTSSLSAGRNLAEQHMKRSRRAAPALAAVTDASCTPTATLSAHRPSNHPPAGTHAAHHGALPRGSSPAAAPAAALRGRGGAAGGPDQGTRLPGRAAGAARRPEGCGEALTGVQDLPFRLAPPLLSLLVLARAAAASGSGAHAAPSTAPAAVAPPTPTALPRSSRPRVATAGG